jgi:hypothetical protein
MVIAVYGQSAKQRAHPLQLVGSTFATGWRLLRGNHGNVTSNTVAPPASHHKAAGEDWYMSACGAK